MLYHFQKITNARILHKRGARLLQTGPIGLRPAPIILTAQT
jgi:hypothetical protein